MSHPVVLIPACGLAKGAKLNLKKPVKDHQDHQDAQSKRSNGRVYTPKPSISKTVIEDSADDGSADDDSAEEEIVTAGARATLNHSEQRHVAPRPNITYETHRLPGEVSSEEGSSESESEESEVPSVQPDAKPRHVGFPPVEELPLWFPENIKQMYRVDRHGGALSYNASPSLLS